MNKIKIVSDPYSRKITYSTYKEQTDEWEDINEGNNNSALRESESDKIFLPFKIKDIVDTIVREYYNGHEKVEIIFEGTSDEYMEVSNVCKAGDVSSKITLTKSFRSLENARDILESTKSIFDEVSPTIEKIMQNDPDIDDRSKSFRSKSGSSSGKKHPENNNDLSKVSEALEDIIPICIFGNYSTGKSTFINALIGYEILPSGGDPVTAKVYEISRSKFEDRAKIGFEYQDEDYVLTFDNEECTVKLGNSESDLIAEILGAIEKMDGRDLFSMVNLAVELLNDFDAREKIGNIIKIEIPFSKNGILGNSCNEFIIFDTPGSNSQSHKDHTQVLKVALEGFSNGIPVWVSEYDALDTVDNNNLCEMISDIEALDKRFTMIVVNKADSVELPKSGFTDENIETIKEYTAVSKMYSSGIYFVSSVMGLGSKNKNGFISDYLADVFDEKERKFCDPSARSYKKLYEYNIMPQQIKQKAVKDSLECSNRIYANSGLFCVEEEIEQFASRHSAYNKCQMVYKFLSSTVDETKKRIRQKKDSLDKKKKQWEDKLDDKKQKLFDTISRESRLSVNRFKADCRTAVEQFTGNTLNEKYRRPEKEFVNLQKSLTEQNEADINFAAYRSEYENAKKLYGILSKEVSQLRESMEQAEREIEKNVSDTLIDIVRDRYREDIAEIQSELSTYIKKIWQQCSDEHRDGMIRLIDGASELSDVQKSELSTDIREYEPISFDDMSEKVFYKERFLRGSFLGIRFGSSEKLNLHKLASDYNSEIAKNTGKLADLIFDSCLTSFTNWQSELIALIQENITEYNPELHELTKTIDEEQKQITELDNEERQINNGLAAVRDMMAWKNMQ